MKKIRYLPFGYRISDGMITIHADEAPIVRLVFGRYLEGATMKAIASELNGQPISYNENARAWDDNRIFRILKKSEYCGTEEYPALITTEIFEKATAICKTKSYKINPDLTVIRKRITCLRCGSRLYRRAEKKQPGKGTWKCRECGLTCGPIPDQELVGRVVASLNRAIEDTEAFQPPDDLDNRLSLTVSRLTNEINRELERPQAVPEKLIPLILECAAEKYSVCGLGEHDPATMQVKAALASYPPLEAFDGELFEQVISQVLLQPDGAVRLCYRNGQILE